MSQVTSNTSQINTVTAKNLAESQVHLLNVISSQRFLNNEGLNNEVPFHICPFGSEIREDMNHAVRQLKNELADKGIAVRLTCMTSWWRFSKTRVIGNG